MEESQLKNLANEIREINFANRWKLWQPNDFKEEPYKFGTVIALIHSEASEALEWYRKKKAMTTDEMVGEIKEEMADIIIRVLDWWGAYEDDPMDTIKAKLNKNRTRGKRHGNKLV